MSGIARILIADRFGVLRDEVIPQVASISWVLNGIGKMEMEFSVLDDKATPDNLAISNRVWVEFDNGLPPWAGIIDLPRSWRDDMISVTAYTVEHILQYRISDRSSYFENAPAGAILMRMIREMEARQPEGIRIGEVWLGGAGHYPAYHFKSLWDIMRSIRRMESCDIVFQPQLESGRIFWLARLKEQWGVDKSASVVLAEGYNISEISYEEQGPLYNYVVAAGSGTTWTNERLIVAGEDEESIERYGLRERMEVYSDVSMLPTLEKHAQARLDQSAWPLRRFGLTVVDAEPGTFAAYDVGDIVRLMASSVGWGYDGNVRVIAREFRADAGICRLAVDEWREGEIFIRDLREAEE